jgi:hypothetical protein
MGGRIDGSRANAVAALARRREAQGSGRALARRGELLHAAGCMLFWACRLTVCDTQLVQSIYGAIQEYAGFDREEWVM